MIYMTVTYKFDRLIYHRLYITEDKGDKDDM